MTIEKKVPTYTEEEIKKLTTLEEVKSLIKTKPSEPSITTST